MRPCLTLSIGLTSDAEALMVPARELINVIALAQALVFAAVLTIPRFRRSRANWFLVAALFILAMVKADQLYQVLGGFRLWPSWGYVLAPVQWLLTPCLYLFVLARVNPEFSLRKIHWLHAIPALIALAYFAQYYGLDASGKTDLLASGWQHSRTNRLIIPLLSDGIQLTYLTLALVEINRFGVRLRNWFSAIEGRDIRWLRNLLTLWAFVVLAHAAFTLSRGWFETGAVSRWVLDGMNVLHWAFINALMILGVIDHLVQEHDRGIGIEKSRPRDPVLSDTDRQALFEKINIAMEQQHLYLQSDLTLDELASAVGAKPRQVSEAINLAGSMNFYDFVNRHRVHYAAEKLINDPQAQVIEVAYDAGFNSKSTFNQAFKRHVGRTPSQFRKSNVKSADS